MNSTTSNPSQKTCGGCNKSNFNYCLFSKALVAVPALTAAAYLPLVLFDNPLMQIVGSAAAVVLTIYAAIKIDRIPSLQKKVNPQPEKEQQ